MNALLRPVRPLLVAVAVAATVLAGCGETSFVQKNSPADTYKDYRAENLKRAAVLGMGEPISKRQMASNATFSLSGDYTAEEVLGRVAGTYNVAIRWGNGVRKSKRQQVVMNNLSFEEARSYTEDVYGIQVIREGDRRLLVLPSAAEPRLKEFNPGDNVSLAAAVRGLAAQCNYNLVVNENQQVLADTRVSTVLKDVTCYDAFDALLTPHGLSLNDMGDFYSIGGLPQRQWTVSLDEPERAEEVEVSYSSDITSTGGSDSGGGSSTSAGGKNKVTVTTTRNLWEELQKDLEDLLENTCSDTSGALSSATINQEVMEATTTLLPPPSSTSTAGDNAIFPAAIPAGNSSSNAGATSSTAGAGEPNCGYVRINTAVGLVQMRASKAVLDEADEIIRRVSDIAGRRLLLESRVLAVSRTRGFDQRGAVRGGLGDRTDSGVGSLTSGGSITATIARELATLSGASIAGNNFNPGGVAFRNNNLEAVLGLIEQYGTTYELMHPLMELMDRQRATLIDGRNEKYFVITTESTTGTSTTTNNSLDERSQFLGLQFSASAQIAEEGEPHTVSVQIPITSLVKNVNIPDPNDPTRSSGQAPVASTRLIDQKVRIRDGEIKVIGGLTKTVAIDRESGLPVVREVPGLGKLANEENLSYENVEFVVLLQVRRLK
jgi:hypothetical protein